MKIPSHLEKYVSPQVGREMRLMAAKGMIDMGPEDLVTLFSILIGDSDPEVSEAAKKGIEGIPAQVLLTITEKGLTAIDEDLKREKEGAAETERENFYKRIQRMSVAEKVKMALLGNKEAREILLKDTNKLVSSSVLRNPRITEEEILRAVNSKTTPDEILRQVAGNREWVKKYPVKLGIVNNPKTPLAISMHFLGQLNEKDIRQIAKSKNVASVLSTAAKKVVMLKEKR